MRIAVTGGRRHTNFKKVVETLDELHSQNRITVLAHGDATGADTLCARWARVHGVSAHRYDAEWNKYRQGAGPKRNEKMLKDEKPDLLVAFPGGKGTANCIKIAESLGIQVMRVGPTPSDTAAPKPAVKRVGL
jgi:hypothetical protein